MAKFSSVVKISHYHTFLVFLFCSFFKMYWILLSNYQSLRYGNHFSDSILITFHLAYPNLAQTLATFFLYLCPCPALHSQEISFWTSPITNFFRRCLLCRLNYALLAMASSYWLDFLLAFIALTTKGFTSQDLWNLMNFSFQTLFPLLSIRLIVSQKFLRSLKDAKVEASETLIQN